MKKKSSLKQRLNVLILVCLLPLTGIILYLLVQTSVMSSQYDQIVEKITKANAYNIEFKDEIDYTMYIIVVNSERASELTDVNRPRQLIAEAREVFEALQKDDDGETTQQLLSQILQSLHTLDERVVDLQESVAAGDSYESNMESLDLDIRVLTELIQEQIQNYIYEQSQNLEQLRAGVRTEVDTAIRLTVVLLAVILIGAFLISRRITEGITGPISRLARVTEQAGKGNFEIRTQQEDIAEVDVLSTSFNRMVERLGQLVEDIHVEELHLRDAELRLLQEQINPHFLYNTLDNIIWLAESGQTDQVVHMVSALSAFFRTSLSNGKEYVTVKDEREHIESYLDIQQYRYRDILTYEINIDQDIYDCRIMKLVLQPLVENALYHGIKNKRGGGNITVSGSRRDGKLVFEVKDTGIGMTEERLNEVRAMIAGQTPPKETSGGFGLYNVNERLRLNYGEASGISVFSEYRDHTILRVEIPEED